MLCHRCAFSLNTKIALVDEKWWKTLRRQAKHIVLLCWLLKIGPRHVFLMKQSILKEVASSGCRCWVTQLNYIVRLRRILLHFWLWVFPSIPGGRCLDSHLLMQALYVQSIHVQTPRAHCLFPELYLAAAKISSHPLLRTQSVWWVTFACWRAYLLLLKHPAPLN